VNPPQPPEPLARVVDNALDLRIGLDRHTLQRCITRQVTPSPAASSCLTWLKTRTPRNPATLSAAMSSVWNPDNVRDVAESVGIASLADNVVDELARDVDFRLAQVLEEAMKFMRHGKRTTLTTKDISNALKVLNVEPLYGYESTRPLRFGEASLGPGQPLYYVEDEEVDFEKLINAPLPKVPREITFTGTYRAHAPFGIPAINF
jgi:histone H3/H4